jgi:hypothetical protein
MFFLFPDAFDNISYLGDPGNDGLDGKLGEKGEKGDKGMTGSQGMKGDKGATGEKGLKGDKGDNGNKGMSGNKGMFDMYYTLSTFINSHGVDPKKTDKQQSTKTLHRKLKIKL